MTDRVFVHRIDFTNESRDQRLAVFRRANAVLLQVRIEGRASLEPHRLFQGVTMSIWHEPGKAVVIFDDPLCMLVSIEGGRDFNMDPVDDVSYMLHFADASEH